MTGDHHLSYIIYMRAKQAQNKPQTLGGTALKRGADNKMKFLPSSDYDQLAVSKKVVILHHTTSRLIKKSKKIVKILDLVYIDISLDDDLPFFALFIKTAKYDLIPASAIIKVF